MRARYYDQSSGRFTRRDDYEGRLGEPLTLHKYFYAHGNPVNGIDPSGRFSILSTSVTINVLTYLAIVGISDILFPNPLQTPTHASDIAGSNPYKAPFEILAGLITGAILTRYLLSSATIQVFRVEGSVNARVLIGEGGEVLLDDSGKMLFLNFGQKARAHEFFLRRLEQGMSDVQIRSFKVPKSYLDDIRASSVPESLARRYPDRPIQVDVTKAPDQFGLRSAQIKQLQRAIIQGSGEVEP